MPTHFIYSQLDKTKLMQGDVLKRTPKLSDLLKKQYKWYGSQEAIKYFLVLTQTCDLARRKNTPYITIGAICPVEDALRLEAKRYQEWWQGPNNVLDTKSREKFSLLVERLLDNNEPNYFYLHEEAPEISHRVCAFLTLSVSLDIEHYDTCLEAKIAQLTPAFQAKLGWLVGHVYNRVGTDEWDQICSERSARQEAGMLIKSHFIIIPKEQVDKGKEELERSAPLTSRSPPQIYEAIRNTNVRPKRASFREQAKEKIQNSQFLEKLAGHIVNKLRADTDVESELGVLLRESGAHGSGSDVRAIRSIFERFIIRTLHDPNFSGREKIAKFLVAELDGDTIIRSLLT